MDIVMEYVQEEEDSISAIAEYHTIPGISTDQNRSTSSTDSNSSSRSSGSYTREDFMSNGSASSMNDFSSPSSPEVVKPRDVYLTRRSTSSNSLSNGSVVSDGCGSLNSFSKLSISSQNLSKEEGNRVKAGHISNEFVRLSEVIDTMPAEQLKEVLKQTLQKRDSKSVVAMSLLLPRKSFPPIENLHCVRCHKVFNPTDNSTCQVRHPNASVVAISKDRQGANFHCRSCLTDFRLNNMHFYNENINSYMSGFCYSGKHTTNPLEVNYRGAVRSCEDHGCVEIYV